MADLATLKNLCARVSEPDRHLDADICVALQYVPGKAGAMHVGVYKTPDGTPAWLEYDTSDHETGWAPIPGLTASVDAALALAERVLPGTLVVSMSCNDSDPTISNPFYAEIGVKGSSRGQGGADRGGVVSGFAMAILEATIDALIAQAEDATR